MTDERRASPPPSASTPRERAATDRHPRIGAPRAALPAFDDAEVTRRPTEIDVHRRAAAIADARRRRCRPRAPRRSAGAASFSALGGLLTLAFGLWVDSLVRDLFARDDWLGWLAMAVAAPSPRSPCSSSCCANSWLWPASPRSGRSCASTRERRRRLAHDEPWPAAAIAGELAACMPPAPRPPPAAPRWPTLSGEVIDGARPPGAGRARTAAPARHRRPHPDPGLRQARLRGHRGQPARDGRSRLCRAGRESGA